MIEAHDKIDIALSVVTDSIHQLKDYDKPKALDTLKAWHDRAAGLQEKYRGKVVCFASTVPTAGDDFNKELERAFTQLKLKGVFITSVTEYRTEVGDRLVARSTLVLLRYDGSSPRDGA